MNLNVGDPQISKAMGTFGAMTASVKELEGKQSEELKKLIQTAEDAGEIEDMNKAKEDLEAELDDLNKEKTKLEKKIELIQKEVENLTAEAIKLYEEAIDEQEELSEEQKAESKKISNEQINKYIEECQTAAEKGEEGPPRSDLSGNIESALKNSNLSFDAKFTNVMRNLAESNEMFDEIDDHLDAVRGYAFDIQAIDMDIKNTNDAIDKVDNNIKAKEAEKCTPPPTCDPIGFVANDGTQYDFVVAGENGTLDSTSEFLGAEDQWAAMQKLDTDADGKVTSEELEEGGVSVVANKGNEAKDISDTFGEEFSIDLNSYKSGANQTVAGVSDGDHDADGYADQELLGTFQVNMGDETITGYNTLDDVDYLKEQYNIEADTDQRTLLDEDLQSKIEWVDSAQQTSDIYHNKIENAYTQIGLDESQIESLQTGLKSIAGEQANAIRAEYDAEAEEFAQAQIAEQEAAEAAEASENAEPEYSLEGDSVLVTKEDGTQEAYVGEVGEEIEIDGETYVFNPDGSVTKKDEVEEDKEA